MKTKGYKQDIQNRLKPHKTKNNTETMNTQGFDYNIRDSDRRPLLKSASTDVIISNHGPI